MFTTFLEALKSVRENATRSILSAIGIMVGTMAVMLLVSISTSVKDSVRNQVEGLGSNLIVVLPGIFNEDDFTSGGGSIGVSPLTRQDVLGLKQVEGVRNTAKWMFIGGGLTSGSTTAGGLWIACDPEWLKMGRHEYIDGQGFTEGHRYEAVIGQRRKNQLFGTEESGLGKEIQINGVSYVIVGVLKAKEDASFLSGGQFIANIVYLPFDAAAEAAGQEQIHRIWVQTDPSIEPNVIKSRIENSVLKTQNGVKNFTVLTQEELLKAIFNVLNLLTYLVVGISAIALVVGGVGIMAVMLMNVNERKPEIGLRKTVGATRFHIFKHFLMEAVILTSCGGILGLIATRVAILLLEVYTPIDATLTFPVILLGFSISIGVGCVFGLLPAIRASLKDPVECMR